MKKRLVSTIVLGVLAIFGVMATTISFANSNTSTKQLKDVYVITAFHHSTGEISNTVFTHKIDNISGNVLYCTEMETKQVVAIPFDVINIENVSEEYFKQNDCLKCYEEE